MLCPQTIFCGDYRRSYAISSCDYYFFNILFSYWNNFLDLGTDGYDSGLPFQYLSFPILNQLLIQLMYHQSISLNIALWFINLSYIQNNRINFIFSAYCSNNQFALYNFPCFTKNFQDDFRHNNVMLYKMLWQNSQQ